MKKANTGWISRISFATTNEFKVENSLKDGDLRGVGGQMASVL